MKVLYLLEHNEYERKYGVSDKGPVYIYYDRMNFESE